MKILSICCVLPLGALKLIGALCLTSNLASPMSWKLVLLVPDNFDSVIVPSPIGSLLSKLVCVGFCKSKSNECACAKSPSSSKNLIHDSSLGFLFHRMLIAGFSSLSDKLIETLVSFSPFLLLVKSKLIFLTSPSRNSLPSIGLLSNVAFLIPGNLVDNCWTKSWAILSKFAFIVIFSLKCWKQKWVTGLQSRPLCVPLIGFQTLLDPSLPQEYSF